MTSAAIQQSEPPVSGGHFAFWSRRLREDTALGTPSYVQDRRAPALPDPFIELLARTAQGDRAAFKSLYDLAAPQLFGVALALLKQRDLAEDLLQDAFLAIWQKAAHFTQDRGAPMAWMAMIVRHRAIDRLRTAKRRPQEANLDSANPSEIPAEDCAPPAAGQDVSKALAVLPENHRRAVMLAFVEGLTHEELALRLHAPLGTVKSWVRRGLMALKESLQS